MSADAPAWYDAHASELAPVYEAIDPARLHAWLADLLPGAGARVLDIGAGTGRDAAWLAGLGMQVTAVEPSSGMREQGRALHAGAAIDWVEDALPELTAVRSQGVPFDLVLLSAVWMHVPPAQRGEAFANLMALTRPGGWLALTLRHGPHAAGDAAHPVSEKEVERLAQAHGATIARRRDAPDHRGRPGVSWTCLAIRRGAK